MKSAPIMVGIALASLIAMAEAQPMEWTSSTSGDGFAAAQGDMLVAEAGVVSKALVLSFPGRTDSTPGDFAEWSAAMKYEGGGARLRFYMADDFTGPTRGYHFLQVRLGDEVLWETDVAGGNASARQVEVALPAREAGEAVALSLRLVDKKLVTNFPVTVRIAGVELREEGKWTDLLPLESANPKYREFPEDLALDALPPTGGWSWQASIIQPWGVTQTEAVVNADVWAPKFGPELGFDAIIMLPTDAHNAITVPRGRQGITEEQFKAALAAYRANRIKAIIYTAIMHSGHNPKWQFGDLSKEHPEWSMRDPDGGTVTMYGYDWLCPSTGAREFTLQYTEDLVRRYDADAVMLDNNEFMNSNDGKPTCYCDSCKAGFGEYVRERFGGEEIRELLGVDAGEVKIPLSDDDAAWGLWLSWRKRLWGEATEEFRVRLREIKPDIVVLANTQYRYKSWVLAVDGQYEHEDAILAESRSLSAPQMAAKMLLGRALAQNRPLWNYIGTFDDDDFSKLRSPDLVEGIVTSSIASGASPWIVFYGFTGEENQPSLQVMSTYLKFWRKQAPMLGEGEDLGDVGVVMSPESRDIAGAFMPPAWVEQMLTEGYAAKGLWGPAVWTEDELAGLKVIVATHGLCMRMRNARALAAWVRQGGTLVIQPETAWRDEYGRWRDCSALQVATGVNVSPVGTHEVGAGKVVSLADEDIVGALGELARPRVEAEFAASVYWRGRADGREVMAVAAHEEPVGEIAVRLPDHVSEVTLLQPGAAEQTLTCARADEGNMVRFEMSQRLAVVAFDGAGP